MEAGDGHSEGISETTTLEQTTFNEEWRRDRLLSCVVATNATQLATNFACLTP